MIEKRKLIYDDNDTPYSFLFDKTRKSQVKKQYGMYLSYWSKHKKEVGNSYVGSLFVDYAKLII